MAMSNWAEDEVQTADLDDQRLNKRLALLLERLGEHPQLSIPVACGGWKETLVAYRFFDNDKATFEKILAPHRDSTVERMKSCPVVLLAQDTTAYDENINLGPKGLGTLKDVTKRSRRLHPTVAFTPSRICLGIVKAAYWARDTASPRQARRCKGVDEKESRHWLESYQDSCALQTQMPDSLLVNIADREGDLYEWFAEYLDYASTVRAQWIIRATQNRDLLVEPDTAAKWLWAALEQAPVLGHADVHVKPRPNRAARLAHITLRAATVTLKPP
ncbi:IS4 family transposase, partial [Methylomonas sp. WSC-7]